MLLMENKEQPRLLSVRVTDLEKKVRVLDKKVNSIILKQSGGK